MDRRFIVGPHVLDPGQRSVSPSATPPRRLRKSGLIEPRLGSVQVDLNTDNRIRYFYDIDDSVSKAIWVTSGRAEGWNDTGPNSYHLNQYSKGGDYIKPYHYDDPGPGILNGHPGLYFNGDMGSIDGCVLFRDSQDVFVYNTGSGGVEMQGFLFMMVFHQADQLYNWPIAAVSTYPRVNLLMRDGDYLFESYCWSEIGLGNQGRDWTSGSNNFPEGEARGMIRTPRGSYPELDETHIMTVWGDMNYFPGMVSYRLDGKHRQTSWIQTTVYDNISFYADFPGHYREQHLFGACNQVNQYRATQKWYWGCAFLAYGDFTYGEIAYLENEWIDKYDITRET